MQTTIELLGTQHQAVLRKLAEAERTVSGGSGGDLSGFLDYLQCEVAHHFTIEERALFPVMARYLSLDHGPLAVMNSEHAAFRALLEQLAAAVRGDDRAAQRTHASELIELLRLHIDKEDGVLFPMAGRMLSVAEQHEVDAEAASMERSASPQQA